MKYALFIIVGLLAVVGGAVWTGRFAPAEAADYHVNFEKGADDRDGRTPASAWKHAPGDPAAVGVPARTALGAGDRVIFAAGVRYRGAILVTWSGAQKAPIVFKGETPEGKAVIDGSDPAVEVTACRTPAECGGATAWASMVRIRAAGPLSPDTALFADKGIMRPAQGPDPSDAFYRDEPDDMLEVDGVAMSQGRVTLPAALVAGLAHNQSTRPRLALWVKPNRVVYRPVLSIRGSEATFDPTGLRFYTDRPARAAVIDHPSLVDRPGEYAVLPDGAAVAMLPTGATGVSIGSGRGGFHIRKGSHIEVRDLRFENMSDEGRLPPAGVAVFTEDAGSRDIVIADNYFTNFVMARGQGPIIQRQVEGLRIVGNRIEKIASGSGIRISGSDVLVEHNEMHGIGRTAIMVMNTKDAMVRRNTITDVKGVHGNGISAYLENSNVRFVANTVFDASQPATFHGAKKPGAGRNDLVFSNNLFVATPGALGALISWGGGAKGVRIENNVLLGGKTGLRLNGGDEDVAIANNIASGLIIADGPQVGWRIGQNEYTALSFRQKKDGSVSKTYSLPGNAVTRLAAGEAVAAVCAIMSRSQPTNSTPADARAVGAHATCP